MKLYMLEIQSCDASARKPCRSRKSAMAEFQLMSNSISHSLRLLEVDVHLSPAEVLRRWANNEAFLDAPVTVKVLGERVQHDHR